MDEAHVRLVQDAAHELRTPLTSLRTNTPVLGRLDDLSPAAGARLLDDVEGETRELSGLVEEPVEPARPGTGGSPRSPWTWARWPGGPPAGSTATPPASSVSTPTAPWSGAGRTGWNAQ
ncbi:histidine kinase dimerization/phospho-acceptor domain-containing protein [Streptomyces sp. NPDC090493]|uniref:histidine kinase dimerization/phospho-acceptor domain-containing protein n=1 Tax=Streptomyces sp. NPDC090493 TaxID=3365964 RepID=UPI00381AC577